jgi:hypothetical protein
MQFFIEHLECIALANIGHPMPLRHDQRARARAILVEETGFVLDDARRPPTLRSSPATKRSWPRAPCGDLGRMRLEA